MKTLLRLLSISLLALFLMGATECQHTDTVVAAEGPKSAALGQTRDEQIAALTKRLADEKTQRDKDSAEAAKAASSVKGILKANDYQAPGRPTDAVKEEAQVALTRLPPDDPAETVKALQRAIEMVEGQRDKALADYHAATNEARAAQAAIAAKDKELAGKDVEIAARDKTLAQQRIDAATEKEAQRKTMQATIDAKDAEIAKVKADFASKERATWVLWTRIAGLGLIVIGVVLLAVFKMVAEGAGLAAGGVIIGLISIFIDWLTNQWWFGWMMGGVILAVMGAGGYALYRMWKAHTLQAKTTAALQDLKDEATTLGTDAWSKVKEHLEYRLGDKDSYWAKAQAKAVAALGLVNPKAEAAAQAPDDSGPK